MAKLPRYQRLGIRDRQPQNIDFASYREEAGASMAMSQTFDQMSQFLYRQSAEEAEQRGLERVRTEGAQPVLEALQDQGGPRGIEQKAAYQAANQIAIAQIQSSAELEITRILDEGQKNKTSFSAIQGQLKDVSDGYSAALSDIDPVSAGTLRARLAESAGKAEVRFSKFWQQEQLRDQKIRQNLRSVDAAEKIIQDAADPNFNTKGLDNQLAVIKTELAALGVTKIVIDDWAEKTANAAKKNSTMFTFFQKDVDDQKQYIADVESGKIELPGMTFEESVRFVNGSLRPEFNRNVAAIKGQSDFVVTSAEDLEDILTSGGNIDQDKMQDLETTAVEVSQYDGGVAIAALNSVKATNDFFSTLRASNFAKVESDVAALANGIQGVGGEGRDTAIEVKRYEQGTEFFENMKKELAADPMGYANRVGLIERRDTPLLTINTADGTVTVDQAELRKRQTEANTVRNHYQLGDPKLFYSDEVRQLSLLLKESDGPAKLQLLGALAEVDAAAPKILTDLALYNAPMALVGALNNAGMTETATLAVSGFERIKIDGKHPTLSRKTADGESLSAFDIQLDVMGTALTEPNMTKAITDVAEAIYTELAARNGVTEFNGDMWIEALQQAAGQSVRPGMDYAETVLYGGFQEVRGENTYLMPDMTAAQMENALRGVNVARIAIASGQNINESLAKDIASNEEYTFKYLGFDTYQIQYEDNIVVADQDGRPITFSIKDLKDAHLKEAGYLLEFLKKEEQLALETENVPNIEDAMLSGDIDISSAKMDATRSQDKPSAREAAPEATFTEGFPRVISPRPSRLDAVSKTLSDPTQDFAPGQVAAGLEASIGAPTVDEGQTIKELREERRKAMRKTIPVRQRLKRKEYLKFIDAGLKKDPNFKVSWDDWIKTQ
jgi:hypothetical protein